MKKLLIGMLGGIIVGLAIVLMCDIYMNPGKEYFMTCLKTSEAWAEKLRRESDAPCYILSGSSDVRMSVDPAAMLEENGLRAINGGLHAGNGENINFVAALRLSRPGDTIVSFPVALWHPTDACVPSGFKFLFHHYGVGAFEPGIVDYNANLLSCAFRGNTMYYFLSIEKWILGVPRSYRYHRTSTVHESGWAEVNKYPNANCLPICPLKREPLRVKDTVQHLPLEKEKCSEYGLAYVVQIPRTYRDASYRAQGAFDALYLTRRSIRVLRDPALGVETDAAMMADTNLHQNAAGALAYSRTLARLLANEQYWTEAELVEILHSLGWNEDGTPMAEAPAPAAE